MTGARVDHMAIGKSKIVRFQPVDGKFRIHRARQLTVTVLGNEQHPCAPEDEYGLSKLLGEAMCRRYSAAYGLATICVRINSASGRILSWVSANSPMT